MINNELIIKNLNSLSSAYERGVIKPIPLEVAPKGYDRMLGASKTHITGSKISHIDLWRGYPIVHLRKGSVESLVGMLNPFSGTAMMYHGMIIKVEPILTVPRALTHEGWHFLDWVQDPERFVGWLNNWQNKVPVVGYLTSPLEWYAYANQFMFWKPLPSISGPAASRYHKCLCYHWGNLSGRTAAQICGKVYE